MLSFNNNLYIFKIVTLLTFYLVRLYVCLSVCLFVCLCVSPRFILFVFGQLLRYVDKRIVNIMKVYRKE